MQQWYRPLYGDEVANSIELGDEMEFPKPQGIPAFQFAIQRLLAWLGLTRMSRFLPLFCFYVTGCYCFQGHF